MRIDTAMHFRPLQPDEWSAFQALRLRSIVETPLAIYPTLEEERGRSPEQIRTRIERTPFQVVYGAYAGQALVGIAGLRREPLEQVAHKGVLWGVYLHPDHRGGGNARGLLQALFDHARAEGVTQVHLNVNVENERAAALYRAMGFEAYGREPRAMRVGDTYYDETLMVLRLAPSR